MNLTYTTGAHGSRHFGGQLHFDEGVTVVETVILRGCFSTRISDNDCRAVGYLKLFSLSMPTSVTAGDLAVTS